MSGDNVQIVERVFGAVLLARLLVFKSFLEAASSYNSLDDAEKKKIWLQSQLGNYPCGEDIRYHTILDEVRGFNATLVDSAVTQTLSDISDYRLTDSGPFYIVLDEANHASHKHERAFRENGKYYPVLKAIVRAWQKRLSGHPFVLIVSGTEIPSDLFCDPEEWGGWVWSSNTGAFDVRERYWQYVQRYLPPALRRTSEGERLIERMWNWLRGRRVCLLLMSFKIRTKELRL